MPGTIAGLLAGLQLIVSLLLPGIAAQRLHSGEWLRFHVIAQDDTVEMQRVKLCVRDAVQEAYHQHHPAGCTSMLETAAALLPELTLAARDAARTAGFTGSVEVSLEEQAFTARRLGALEIPAGTYPALVIRLGEARGRNWWGLLDPELSLIFAGVPGETGDTAINWDWSLRALLHALLGRPLPEGA